MSQLYLFVPDGWRDCSNPECAKEWGPMPPRELHASTGLCTVCMIESGEKAREVDRLRYTPSRRQAIVQKNRERAARMTDAEKAAYRDRRREYHRQRYLARKA